jgi:Trypsin-co-occurring domain 1
MTYLLGFPLTDVSNEVLIFEVEKTEVADDLVLASPDPGKVAARAQVTLEEALEKLRPSLHKIIDMFKDLTPNEASVEFGLNMGGETGVIVAKGTAGVNFSVRMTWRSAAAGSEPQS